jgi:hypothetical protein
LGGGFALVVVLLMVRGVSSDEPREPPEQREKGIILPSACINKVHAITGYDKTKLRYIGDNDNFVFVNYTNNYGKIHKFRCAGPSGTIELFANGAGAWLEM